MHKADTFTNMNKDDLEKALEQIKANTMLTNDKTPGAIKLKLHIMNYLGTMCTESSKLSDAFIQIELYRELFGIVKNGHNLEMYLLSSFSL